MINHLSFIANLNQSGIDCTDKQKNIVQKHTNLTKLNDALRALEQLTTAQTISLHLDRLLAHPDLSKLKTHLDDLFNLSQKKDGDAYLLSEEHIVACVEAILDPFANQLNWLIFNKMFELKDPVFLKKPALFLNKINLISQKTNREIKPLSINFTTDKSVAISNQPINNNVPLNNNMPSITHSHKKNNASFFPKNTPVLKTIVSATVNSVLNARQLENETNIEWALISEEIINIILTKEKLSNSPMTHWLINRYGQAELSRLIKHNESTPSSLNITKA